MTDSANFDIRCMFRLSLLYCTITITITITIIVSPELLFRDRQNGIPTAIASLTPLAGVISTAYYVLYVNTREHSVIVLTHIRVGNGWRGDTVLYFALTSHFFKRD
jgi:hypothetical protein